MTKMNRNLKSYIEKWSSNSHVLATRWILLIALTGGLLVSCSSGEQSEQNDKSTTIQSSLELFNGEDLAGWYTYMRRPEPTSEVAGLERNENGEYIEPIGLNHDPLNVFTANLMKTTKTRWVNGIPWKSIL